MSKKIMFSILSLAILTFSTTVLATNSVLVKDPMLTVSQNEIETVYSLKDLSYETVDPEGNMIQSGPIIDNDGNISANAFGAAKTTIGSSHTTYWYPTNSLSGFYLEKDDVIKMSLKLSEAVRIKVALTNGNSKETTDKNPSVSLVQSKTGYSKVGVTNLSSSSITINGGSISHNE